MRDSSRRVFCKNTAGWISAATVLGGEPSILASTSPASQEKAEKEKEEEEGVSPAEDLMREHGVLNRILLIYEEAARRLRAGEGFDAAVLASSASVIRSFVEDYHEKLEEDYLFPRFEKARKLTDLVGVLRAQHQAGRRLTDQVRQLAVPGTRKDPSASRRLETALHAFIRMYRPHEAREDTVLFPALRSIVSANEYDSLGEEFEKKEHQLFGEEGFTKIVDDVAKLEKALGIYDLGQFTPR